MVFNEGVMTIGAFAVAVALAQSPAPQPTAAPALSEARQGRVEGPDCKALLAGTPPPGVAQLCDGEASAGRATAEGVRV